MESAVAAHPEALPSEDLVTNAIEVDGGPDSSSDDEAVSAKKKKKKKSRGGTKFIVDGKVVPRTALPIEEEKALYDKIRTFDERISIAARRFKQRAGLSGILTTVFDNYLVYGAIGVWPDMINGDPDPGSGAAKVDSYGRKYVLDVQFIVRAFLSTVNEITPDPGAYDVIKSFLRYLVDFEVCPEYVTDIAAAAEICDTAKKEAVLLTKLGSALPGYYNKACSALSGGYYADLEVLPPREKWGPLEILAEKTVSGQDCVSSEDTAFEVMEIILGKEHSSIIAKQWINPAWPLSEMDPAPEDIPLKQWTFIIDSPITENLRVGIKIEATVRELENGTSYFDKTSAILHSFYKHYEKPEGYLYEGL